MNNLCFYSAFFFLFLGFSKISPARNYVNDNNSNPDTDSGFRQNCIASSAQKDLEINNVRARLMAGGDMWWDGVGTARYIIPNVDPASGEPEISSLFAGAIWLGAYDNGGNLIVAGQTYGQDGDDYWTGPLSPQTGIIQKNECERWDKHFTVYGADIDALRADFLDPLNPGIQKTPSKGLLGWPAKGNAHFAAIHGFDILDYNQDLAPFIDADNDGIYDPYQGDHPIIEVTGCAQNNYFKTVYADQMTWWVYNDNGNIHGQSNAQPMKMEIQVTAFAYATTDAINDMTFYRYKLLNRNSLSLVDTYFSLWTDPDLGCYADDFIGCDTVTGMGYVYNADADDDNPCGGTSTNGYGTDIPALAVDYFRGPLDSAGNQIGLSGFQYHIGGDPGPMGDPETGQDFYGYMSGYWKDGTPVTAEGNGYNPNSTVSVPTNYVFPSFPDQNNSGDWSMCKESLSGLDLRFLHTSGPFVLQPGATNEMISGVVWVPSVPDYPCPSLKSLVAADVLAQNLFDDCFRITNGPDAPYMDVIELENELVLNLSYSPEQNNFNLNYSESPSKLSPFAPLDTTYNFQGYLIYQVNDPNLSVTELDDPEKARIIYQCDVDDNISKIANWEKFTDEDLGIDVNIPTLMVEGEDKGIKHTFRVLEDQFAEGEKGLINHKPYYFCVVAYAHNEYQQFDPIANTGQANPYLQGRRNYRVYTGIPRINDSEYSGMVINSEYGDRPRVTRLDGQGAGAGQFLEIYNIDSLQPDILAGNNIGRISYNAGKAPVDIKIVDPLRVAAGNYQLHICDQNYLWSFDSLTGTYGQSIGNYSALSDSVYWVLSDVNDPTSIWSSFQTMDLNYEQYIPDLGISISCQQAFAPSQQGEDQINGLTNWVGAQILYSDSTTYGKWYRGVEDSEGILNMIKNSPGEVDELFDPEKEFSTNIGGWYPFMLCDGFYNSNKYYISLMNIGTTGSKFREANNPISGNVRDTMLSALNNVNIVFTSDSSDWSRCMVTETCNKYYDAMSLSIPSGRSQGDWRGRQAPGLPIYYSRNKDMSIDSSSFGMSWFPGYAYDVETGQRLNIFFGENSIYNGDILEETINQGANTGNDMIFNPTSTAYTGPQSIDEKVQLLGSVLGGQHIVYVTRTPYDSCQAIIDQVRTFIIPGLFEPDHNIIQGMDITWASMALLQPGISMKGAHNHIPPTEATVKLRVNRPHQIENGTFENRGYPLYEFALNGFQPTKESGKTAVSALDLMRVVPNPYYAYSDYEVTEMDNIVKFTNLPAQCNIRIYSLDGRFVKEYKVAQEYDDMARNGIARLGQYGSPYIENQISTSVEWDLKNYASVPVASGVYLVHIKVEGVGSKVLKSFIINRAFDAQRL